MFDRSKIRSSRIKISIFKMDIYHVNTHHYKTSMLLVMRIVVSFELHPCSSVAVEGTFYLGAVYVISLFNAADRAYHLGSNWWVVCFWTSFQGVLPDLGTCPFTWRESWACSTGGAILPECSLCWSRIWRQCWLAFLELTIINIAGWILSVLLSLVRTRNFA